jgi:hypothetical protein
LQSAHFGLSKEPSPERTGTGELEQLEQLEHFASDFGAPPPGKPRFFCVRIFLRANIFRCAPGLSASR